MSAGRAGQQMRGGSWWPALAAVGGPLLVYLAVIAGGYDGRSYLRGDSPYYYLTGVSLLADGDLDLSNQLPGETSRHSHNVSLDQRGRFVPKHPILLSLASLPLLGLFGPPGALAFNILQLGLLAVLLYWMARRVSAPWAAAVAAAVTGGATVLPHYAWNYSPDVLSTVLLASALVALPPREGPVSQGRLLAAGLLLGLAVVSKFPLFVTAPFFLFLLPRPLLHRAVTFVFGLAIPLLLLGAYNTHLFGAPWVSSYDRIVEWTGEEPVTYSQRRDFGDPLGEGLFRQVMDRSHGLLPTSPVTLLSLAGLPWLWRRRPHLAAMVAGSATGLLLFFGTYRLWNHSHFGNRFLLPIVALAVLPLAPAVEAAGGRLAHWWARRRTLRPSRTDLALTLIVVLQLVPLWAVPYVPTQDGPAHVGNAALLLDLHRQDRPLLGEYYELNPRAGPTWGSHLALAGLLALFPPLVAEKLLLSAYLVLFPLAVRFALRALRPGAQDVAFLALPISASYLYHMGFHSFCWSLVVFCVLLAYWLRRGGELRFWRERLAFGALGLLLWIGHPVTVGATAVGVIAAGAWLALRGSGEASPGGRLESLPIRLQRYCGVPLLALAPAAALVAAFALKGSEVAVRWLPLGQRFRSLATLDVLVSFERRELWLSGGLAVLLLAVGGAALWKKLRHGRWSRADALLPVALTLLGLYLAAPNTLAGGGWVSPRLLLLSVLTLVLWLGAQPLAPGLRIACQVAPALIALGLAALHGAKYKEISPYLEEYLELAHRVPSGATLLPVAVVPWGTTPEGRLLSSRVQPFAHAAGHLAAETGNAVVLLANYQAAKGHFPVRYRKPLGALAAGGPEAAPPPLDELLGRLDRSGARVDLVLFWGSPEQALGRPAARRFLEQLAASFVPVAGSEPSGLGRLYVSAALLAPPDPAARLSSPGVPDG